MLRNNTSMTISLLPLTVEASALQAMMALSTDYQRSIVVGEEIHWPPTRPSYQQSALNELYPPPYRREKKGHTGWRWRVVRLMGGWRLACGTNRDWAEGGWYRVADCALTSYLIRFPTASLSCSNDKSATDLLGGPLGGQSAGINASEHWSVAGARRDDLLVPMPEEGTTIHCGVVEQFPADPLPLDFGIVRLELQTKLELQPSY